MERKAVKITKSNDEIDKKKIIKKNLKNWKSDQANLQNM
jgi:hypothetical protein